MCEESGFFCGSVHPFICQRTRQGPIPCTALQSDLMSINVCGTVETEKNVRQGMTACPAGPRDRRVRLDIRYTEGRKVDRP